MLQIGVSNLQTTVYLDPGVALKLAQALTDQAWEVSLAEFGNDGEVDAGPWAPEPADVLVQREPGAG